MNDASTMRSSGPVTRPDAPPAPGDRVQVRPEYDETLKLFGKRTSPGTVTAIHDGDVGMTLTVELDEGQSVPYPPHELDRLALLPPLLVIGSTCSDCLHPAWAHATEGHELRVPNDRTRCIGADDIRTDDCECDRRRQ